jgi:hypothetical protein
MTQTPHSMTQLVVLPPLLLPLLAPALPPDSLRLLARGSLCHSQQQRSSPGSAPMPNCPPPPSRYRPCPLLAAQPRRPLPRDPVHPRPLSLQIYGRCVRTRRHSTRIPLTALLLTRVGGRSDQSGCGGAPLWGVLVSERRLALPPWLWKNDAEVQVSASYGTMQCRAYKCSNKGR